MISIFCDGSSSGKSHLPGGYGFVIVRDDKEILGWGYGGHHETTNNLMELEGAICGLMGFIKLGFNETVELVSDSQYTLGIANGFYHPTANLESAKLLRNLALQIQGLRFRWVKGHRGHKWNEKVDELAKMGKMEYTTPELQKKVKAAIREDEEMT